MLRSPTYPAPDNDCMSCRNVYYHVEALKHVNDSHDGFNERKIDEHRLVHNGN